jgi:hypothetical protein
MFMKTLIFTGCFVALLGTLGMADTTAPAPTDMNPGPCKKIIQACEQAGFQKGLHKKTGKGLYLDCMNPIMAGKTVSGVTVDSSLISGCRAARAEHPGKKQTKTTTPPAQ